MISKVTSCGFCTVLFYVLLGSLLLSETVLSDDHHTWDYGDHGPSQWPKLYDTCNGNRQSPINLVKPFDQKSLGAVNLLNYNVVLEKPQITNNGHSAQLSANDVKAKITGGYLKEDSYIFQQLHFHWGSNDTIGSEHFIDGKQFPLEMHFVHSNKKYTLAEAPNQPDGLAVLGVFFEVKSEDNPNMKPIVDGLQSIQASKTNTSIKGELMLQSLIPKNPTYMAYDGSLTTPGCNQAVTWIVYTNPLSISEKQLNAFRDLYFDVGKTLQMVNNFRSIQELNKRKIVRYTNSATTIASSILPVFFSMLYYFTIGCKN